MNNSLPQDNDVASVRRPSSLSSEVYEALYGQLMSHKIPPGGRISVDSLVRALGVSQTPIREALSRLEAQGLVVRTHLLGYRSADQMDRRQFDSLYELRLLLEPFAAARLALNNDARVISELNALDAEMLKQDTVQSRAAYGEFAKCDAAFHSCIARNCGNQYILDSLQRLHIHVHLFRLYFHTGATQEANQEHEAVIAAISAGNPQHANEAMRFHIERSKARFALAFV